MNGVVRILGYIAPTLSGKWGTIQSVSVLKKVVHKNYPCQNWCKVFFSQNEQEYPATKLVHLGIVIRNKSVLK